MVCLEDGLEDSLQYNAFDGFDSRKTSSTNVFGTDEKGSLTVGFSMATSRKIANVDGH